ncbi:PAS domain S-box protein [Candidatus Woesearchaeota archaeon]|nr:PAS domain S-box protein [Candidatus Woesearchaeota archaeon]
MDENLILNVIRNSNEVIIATDLQGNVTLWNNGAESLFGYTEREAIGKFIPFIKNSLSYEIQTIIDKAKSGQSLNFRTQKQDKYGKELDLIFNTSPLFNGDFVVGVSIIIQRMDLLKNTNYLSFDIDLGSRESKRTFNVIRDLILLTVGNEKKTINQISTDSGINWRTVEKHLTFLIGKKLVIEIFSSEYVRIFELTNNGKSYNNQIKKENYEKYFKKEEKQ